MATLGSMNERLIQGTAVAPGQAFGPVHVVHAGQDVPTWTVRRRDIPFEIARLANALNAASKQLEERQRMVRKNAGEKDAEIFAVHRMILQDPVAMREVESAITEQQINAEAAVQMLISRFEKTMGDLDGDSVRFFASDVSDPWRLVLDQLLERDREDVIQTSERVIVAAAELTPQVVTFLQRGLVLGVVAEKGGRFSHGAVLARSFGLPCVVGIPNLLARLEQGMVVTVDGGRGEIRLEPSEEQLAEFVEGKESAESRQRELAAEGDKPAVTPDGRRFGVHVNVESVYDLDTFDIDHVDGVGLLRTEFLYMERNQFPSEEEQFRMYRRVIERMQERPVTMRLLDIGGDKPLPYFKTPPETNPALGWRGIRITLQWRDFMRVQLRAFLRAGSVGRMRVLVPMVTNLEELLTVRSLFGELRALLRDQGYDVPDDVPMGAMIEVPSSLLALHHMIDALDFVSVGTNDLVQYLLAVDRDNSLVADLYDPYHPAVLQALQNVATQAVAAGKPCSVCGDMAGDPATALVLLGMGYDSVSVAPQFVPEIKYAVRRTSSTLAAQYAEEVLAESTQAGVRSVMEKIRVQLYRTDS